MLNLGARVKVPIACFKSMASLRGFISIITAWIRDTLGAGGEAGSIYSNDRIELSSLTSKAILFAYKYNPSGSPSLFVFITLSRADLKSAICTLILRSLRAISPASEQMALMSAPERSSF